MAKKEGIDVSDAELEMLVKSWPAQAEKKPDPEKLHWNMLEVKVYDWLLSQAQITEEKFQPPSRIITP